MTTVVGQIDLFSQEVMPPHVKGSPTSLAAAEKALPKAEQDRRAILALLRAVGPLCDDAILARTNVHHNAVRARRGELCDAGLVTKFDHKGTSATGKSATRWTATPKSALPPRPA